MQVLISTAAPEAAAPLARMFRQHGFGVDIASTLERCCSMSMTDHYAAVVHLQRGDFQRLAEFFTRWKSEGCASPFIVLASSQSGMDRARALELGVDAYHIEPYSYARLIAEVAAYAFRGTLHDRPSVKTYHFEVDAPSRTVLAAGHPLPLTRTEFDLLTVLLRRRGSVLSRVQIWEEVWGNREYPLANTIDVHVARLRRKLERAGLKVIRTVHGIGYRLHEEA